ncbi:ankyrin repeat-containing protein [Acrasis kona]|uniref:Ankyrin repeat-containing protein n=1 Tax=Acrasis kona TaxID=1008807 RepID=A0AAW2ZFK4_9EUKA
MLKRPLIEVFEVDPNNERRLHINHLNKLSRKLSMNFFDLSIITYGCTASPTEIVSHHPQPRITCIDEAIASKSPTSVIKLLRLDSLVTFKALIKKLIEVKLFSVMTVFPFEKIPSLRPLDFLDEFHRFVIESRNNNMIRLFLKSVPESMYFAAVCKALLYCFYFGFTDTIGMHMKDPEVRKYMHDNRLLICFKSSKGGQLEAFKLAACDLPLPQVILDQCLLCACRMGKMDLIEYLLELNANPMDGMKGAFQGGNEFLVKYFIEKLDCKPVQCIHDAAIGCKLSLVQLVIDAENDQCDWNLGLNGAAIGGSMDIVELMLEKGATKYQESILCATMHNHSKVVELFIDRVPSSVVQEVLVFSCKNDDTTIADLALRRGANITSECISNASNYNPNTLKFLLGKNVNTSSLLEAYEIAKKNGFLDVQTMLREHIERSEYN